MIVTLSSVEAFNAKKSGIFYFFSMAKGVCVGGKGGGGGVGLKEGI